MVYAHAGGVSLRAPPKPRLVLGLAAMARTALMIRARGRCAGWGGGAVGRLGAQRCL